MELPFCVPEPSLPPTLLVKRSTVLLIQSLASSFAFSLGSFRFAPTPPAPPFIFASFSQALNLSMSRSMDFRASIKGCLSLMSAPAILLSVCCMGMCA